MPASRLSAPVDQGLALKLIRQDLTHREIAERLGVSRPRITQIARSHGLSTPAARQQRGLKKKATNAEQESEILEGLLSGASRNTVALNLGVKYYAVERVALKYRSQYPIISELKRGRSPRASPIPIPAWAKRSGLAADYYDTAALFGEFAAARHCRALKRDASEGVR